jgi:hypothetical protein
MLVQGARSAGVRGGVFLVARNAGRTRMPSPSANDCHAAVNDEFRKPGFRWPLFLGGAGFAAGFFGPMIFVPEANQGPLVGILISGPAGVVLGLAFLGICQLIGVPARLQWRILIGTAVMGCLVVLLVVQPQPALRGYVMDLEVESCATPIDEEAKVIDFWSKRVASVTWVAARPGWQQAMRQTLRDAPGVVLEVAVPKQFSVWENRKPWNRGTLFATDGRNAPEESAFYDSTGRCADFPVGQAFRAFEKYDLNGPIRAPKEWPPNELEEAMPVSPIVPVPARFDLLELSQAHQ